jgi:hypothetical protein
MSSDYSSRARLFRDALYDAFSDAGAGGDDAPLGRLAALVDRCRAFTRDDERLEGALEAFDAILQRGNVDNAVVEALAWFDSPLRFREALYFLRCLDRDDGETLRLAHERAYLGAAVAPIDGYPDLATEQATLLDVTTFEALWTYPTRFSAMGDAIQRWRHGYAPVYIEQHTEYNGHIAAVVNDVEATLWQVDALEKLNRLQRLGEPEAVAALVRYHAIGELFACPQDPHSLGEAMDEAPVCAYCGYRLGDTAPVETLNTTLIAVERGLATQCTRLHQRIVVRLLAHTGSARDDRLQRFAAAVQAADLAGLAQSLDEGMLAFLEDLLATPEPRVNLLDRLAGEFPEVTDESLEAAVAAFRVLMQDELRRGGGRVVISREDDA